MKAASEETSAERGRMRPWEFILPDPRDDRVLQAAGWIPRPSTDGNSAPSVAQWQERVKADVLRAIGTSREKYIKAVETANARAKEAPAPKR